MKKKENNMKYNPQKIEKKWQVYWEKKGFYRAEDFSKKPKKYVLVEFPYPSGDGLHIGHCRSYSALDAIARKKRMEGFNVLYPMGWDAFGLPTENYAIKKGVHPERITKKNIANFKKQAKSLGLSFDWSREISTVDPKYYKWTQWIFLQLFKHGLAYQAEMPINFCPACKIGLANEEVINGSCERCGAPVEKKLLKQWLLRITRYAERLLQDLAQVDYPEKVKKQQINWIGKSCGSQIDFQAEYSAEKISVFTTRIDTLFGVTAIVLAPENPLVKKLTQKEHAKKVSRYLEKVKHRSDFEREQLKKEKTGVFLGSYCLNPVNNEKVPVWVGDYVLPTYGGGAVMMVPAHDVRDYQFAKKYGLKIKEVVAGGRVDKEAFVEYGTLINSGKFNGLTSEQAIRQMSQWLTEKGKARTATQYKLRDWIFSRQHYWGEPIPLVFCPHCADKIKSQKSKLKAGRFSQGERLNPGWLAVPEKDLPVRLPYLKKYRPSTTGQSPLSNVVRWTRVKCPRCRKPAKRETDTMPNWAGSNWYYLRYCDPKNNNCLADKKKLKYWLPVDWYNGGFEHTTLHLLYSRFIYKFLYDLKIVPTPEPYKRRTSHGIVLSDDGRKMSKSLGNVVSPENVIKRFGADALRVCEMFMGPFDQAIAWSNQGVKGSYRFLERIWQLQNKVDCQTKKAKKTGQNKKLAKAIHQTIKKINEDLEACKFNTIISALMTLLNQLEKEKTLYLSHYQLFLIILAPFAPHLSEELWSKLGHQKSIFEEKWPTVKDSLVKEDKINLIIQINGKVRDKVEIEAGLIRAEAEQLALSREKIRPWLGGRKIKRIVFVPDKLINIVV